MVGRARDHTDPDRSPATGNTLRSYRISERWPEIQRIPLVEAEWTNLPEVELKEKANALRRQIVGNILPSGAAIYAAELEAERQRAERALTAQSRFMAQAAQNELERGDYGTALALAVEALPRDVVTPNRPYVVEAEHTLQEIVRHNARELAGPARP